MVLSLKQRLVAKLLTKLICTISCCRTTSPPIRNLLWPAHSSLDRAGRGGDQLGEGVPRGLPLGDDGDDDDDDDDDDDYDDDDNDDDDEV